MTHTEWATLVKGEMQKRNISVQELAFYMRRSHEHIYKQLSGRKPTQRGVNAISTFLGLENYEVKQNEK